MDEKNELNDIILNKNSSSLGNKKVVLAVATLGIVLIIVVMLMNTLASSGTDNLPQAVLPPEPQKEINAIADEPLFEDVSVVQESTQDNISLDEIAQKLKEESTKENTPVAAEAPKAATAPKTVTAPKTAPKEVVSTPKPAASGSSEYYIQVGSFAKYEPNKKFLDSITNLGYKYKFHKVTADSRVINKVLVGPFHSEAEARKALRSVRTSVEAGAFLTKI
ncbi:SPOR domain-containing protein [Sulfurimonas sp.]|uniref:SPOR domain-containing protein n=1 Tax=Sulfurimonas sp. TaxID=2022749 RepID=UPI0025D99EA4|nr:SPOR domain-containing protein [Sulfurimonas sp.]MBW6488025.1 SPOR domain-containing protein [Sulfurimonas sp.]